MDQQADEQQKSPPIAAMLGAGLSSGEMRSFEIIWKRVGGRVIFPRTTPARSNLQDGSYEWKTLEDRSSCLFRFQLSTFNQQPDVSVSVHRSAETMARATTTSAPVAVYVLVLVIVVLCCHCCQALRLGAGARQLSRGDFMAAATAAAAVVSTPAGGAFAASAAADRPSSDKAFNDVSVETPTTDKAQFPLSDKPFTVLPSGVKVKDFTIGSGPGEE
jgi:hypothetical protein